jgi:hypothetical protein
MQQHEQLSPILPPIKIKTAFEELNNKHELLACGIEKIDSILNLTTGDRLAVIGDKKYSQMFLTRLCVNALLLSSSPSSSSKKKNNIKLVASSRFHTSNVILVDAGNSTAFYQHVNFARQYYRRDVISRVLNNTIVTRPFTVYQLADIVINQLPKVIQQCDAKMVVVSDLLDMFTHDPQIGANEATYLTNQIINSITKSSALEDVLVIVSFSHVHDLFRHNNKLYTSYGRTIIKRFNNCIEIRDSKDKKNRAIDVKIDCINNNSKRIKNTNNDFHNGKSLSINKTELLTVSVPTK